ncbi:alpha/beta hydrolase [Riemerella columbina]|uniref:alpha/beta hydrolase n=1 Tax=Riemerella columbina TaxID=103810 RepID=UPI00266FB094|nr:alpha/beta hydrolase-fold protein [Riemerella columbina]WKS94650.1 phospholipase [Riemerella columbina]
MSLHYLIREPQNLSPKTPLLVLLHGYGSNEEDLFSFVPNLPKHWLIVSFRAPKSTLYGGYSWFDINLNNPENFIDIAQAKEAVNLVSTEIEQLKNRYGLTSRTHLCGFSQGGMLSYALALNRPQWYQKVACLSTYPEEQLIKERPFKKEMEALRFFISHGTDDAIIPIEWGQKAADLLYDLGGYFTFREYMSGHSVNQKNYIDLMAFMAEES